MSLERFMCFVCFLSTEQVASSCRSLAARGISAQSLEGGLQSMQAGQGWARQAQWRSVDKWWPGSVQTTCVHPVGCWMWGREGDQLELLVLERCLKPKVGMQIYID